MSRPSRARVTAVVVVGSDRAFLPETLAALAAQTRAPDDVVVACSEADETWLRTQLTDAGLEARVVDVGAVGGPGEALVRAVEVASLDAPWLWLLHDDSAPEPGALAALTQVVETGRSIAVAGCKQVAWSHPDRLVSVGVRYTRDIQRYTGIEDGEVDQGQHDDREDVDAVGTAGMLVDREVLAELGGPDPALGPFLDGRDLSRRARLAGHRVVVVPRAVVRHARAGLLGLRRDPDAAPDPNHSFRQRRTSVLHARLAEAPAPLVPLVALAALLAGPPRAVGRLLSKELPLVVDELWSPFVALAGWGAVLRARRRSRATRKVSPRHLRPLAATWSDIARVRRDQRLQAAAQRRTVRAPSELEMRERAALGLRRRLVLAGVLLVAVATAGVTLAPVAFTGPLLGGALLPSDVGFGELWRSATSSWLASGDGLAVPADPFLLVLGVLSALTGGPFGTPVWVTVAIVLVTAIPLSALAAWFAAGAATRSLAVRAWAAVLWALAPPLVLAISGGRIGPVVAHVLLPLVGLALARAFGLDRRDVVVSGLVGARRVARRTASAPAVEVRRRRLEALAAVADDAPTGQIARVLAGADAASEAPAAGEDGATADQPGEGIEGTEGSEGSESTASTEGARSKTDGGETVAPQEDGPAGTSPDDEVDLRIRSNTEESYDDEEDEPATIVAKPSGVGSLGAAAAAGLCLAAAAAGAPVLLPAGLLSLLLLAVLLGRRAARVAGRARLLLVALPPLVLLAPLLLHAVQVEDGWRLLLAGPGAVSPPAATGSPLLALLGWPQEPATGGTPWLALAASITVVVAAVVALVRSGGLARGVRLAWLVVTLGAAAALLAPRVETGVARTADGADVVATGWAGPGTSLVLLGLLMATATASSGLRTSLHGRSFGWRQVTVAALGVLLAAGVVLAGVAWTTMLRGDALALHTRYDDPVPAIGDELRESGSRARVLAVWVTPSGVVDAELWRWSGPQLTETSSAAALADLDRGAAPDPAGESLQAIAAGLATGTITDAPGQLAEHAVGVVVVPPVDSDVTRTVGDEVARSRLVALLDEVPGLERVTENSSGVVWRVSTAEVTPARAALIGADGVATPVPAEVVGVDAEIAATSGPSVLVLAERADPGWRAWLDGVPLRAVPHGWQQAFEVPAGAGGDLQVRHESVTHVPTQVLIAVIFVVVALIALPTRRRRLDPVEDL